MYFSSELMETHTHRRTFISFTVFAVLGIIEKTCIELCLNLLVIHADTDNHDFIPPVTNFILEIRENDVSLCVFLGPVFLRHTAPPVTLWSQVDVSTSMTPVHGNAVVAREPHEALTAHNVPIHLLSFPRIRCRALRIKEKTYVGRKSRVSEEARGEQRQKPRR